MFSSPPQFEPLLPAENVSHALFEKAHALLLSAQVIGAAHSNVLLSLAPLLREMNSYYTNKIEGQHTLPADIGRAVKADFSSVPEERRKQRIALLHLDAEQSVETEFVGLPTKSLFAPSVILRLHDALFRALPDEDRTLEDGTVLAPGRLRARDVQVGRHIPPAAHSVSNFLDRFDHVYSATRSGELQVLAVAAAHHRLAWIHPFEDGNGRVVRLHSHLLLYSMGLTNGVWSVMRGLARRQSDYYGFLDGADQARAGDLDGRGNLSERGLVAFIDFFLDVCIDQARFMQQMLDMNAMPERIAACLAFESMQRDSKIRLEALHPLRILFRDGEMERGLFKQFTGLGARTADTLLAALLERGLVTSLSAKGKLRFGIPHRALRFYFPSLWPEAEAEAAKTR